MGSSAKRFINAYNTIDHTLRIKYNFKRSMSFSDVIRRAVPLNHTVRRYEDTLIDYGRLRNAIIHNSNDDYVIAEPHNEVVEKMEHIANILASPPKVTDVFEERNVLCAQHDVILKDLIKLIAQSGYSNIPIYKDGGLIGVANGQRILDKLGFALAKGEKLDSYVEKIKAEDAIISQSTHKYFEIVSNNYTIEDILKLFYDNRKLTAVLITKDGIKNEAPIEIITTSDILEMNKILENY